MSKRGADKQLTHDNWDNSDEEDNAGQFQPAGQEVLKSRVIKKARRRINRSEETGSTASPFAAFSGFGAAPKPAANTGNLFSFLSKPASQDTQDSSKPSAQPPLKPFSPEPSKPSTQTPPKPAATPFFSTSAKEDEKENMSSSSPVQARPSIRRSSGSAAASAAPSEYHRQLMALNRCLLSWVQQHMEKSPLCILTPVFRDYEAHLSSIEKKFGGGLEAGSPSAGSTGPSFSIGAKQSPSAPGVNFKFGSSTDSAPTEKPALSTSSGFSFGAAASKPTEANKAAQGSGGFSFGLASPKPSDNSKSTPSAGSGFSFGLSSGKSAEAEKKSTVASSGFSFGLTAGKQADTNKESSSGFSFGLSGGKPADTSSMTTTGTSGFSFGFSAAAAKAAATSESTQQEEESDQPPVVEVKTVQEDDAVYSKRCKLFYKKDGAFVEKGVGMLYLKPCSDDKFQCLIRADTNLGNILLNIKLNKSIPTQRMGKNNVMMACVPNPPLDPKITDSSPVPLLIRVKTGDDADELLKQLDDHKR